MNTLGERLKTARERAGLTQKALAKLAGLKNQSIIGALESGSRKATTYIAKIASVLKVSSLWLSEGIGPMDAEETVVVQIPARPVTVYDTLEELPSETTVMITQIDVEFSAGNGRKTYEIIEKEPLPFQSDYIRRINASPKNLVAVKVTGRSMEPRLFSGDTVLVDRQDKNIPINGGVFAIIYGDDLIVKRLYRLPNGIKVHSDNESEGPRFELFDDRVNEISVVGRVKYRSGTGDF